jgi:hypothetical protein
MLHRNFNNNLNNLDFNMKDLLPHLHTELKVKIGTEENPISNNKNNTKLHNNNNNNNLEDMKIGIKEKVNKLKDNSREGLILKIGTKGNHFILDPLKHKLLPSNKLITEIGTKVNLLIIFNPNNNNNNCLHNNIQKDLKIGTKENHYILNNNNNNRTHNSSHSYLEDLKTGIKESLYILRPSNSNKEDLKIGIKVKEFLNNNKFNKITKERETEALAL